MIALCLGACVGFAFVFVIYIIIDVGTYSLRTWSFHPIYFVQDIHNWEDFMTRPGGFNKYFVMSAFVIHGWLLLFALSLLIVKGLNFFRFAILNMQWFLKSGHEHPFQAIGYVAAAITFLIMLSVKLILGGL